jgi:hypothetical protein
MKEDLENMDCPATRNQLQSLMTDFDRIMTEKPHFSSIFRKIALAKFDPTFLEKTGFWP